MLNHFDAEVNLCKVVKGYSGGFPTETETKTAVWADVQSVKRQEFYAAQSAGVQADIVFVVNTLDFDEHTRVEHDGKTYEIKRAYQTGLDHVELTCARV